MWKAIAQSMHVVAKKFGSLKLVKKKKLPVAYTNTPRRLGAKSVIALKRWYLGYLNAKAKRLYKKAKKVEDRAIWLDITLRGRDSV
tara:strand:+ start:448 stop:705 length:258 start_codon:yes stop_codon:yes gene_type:complete